MIFMIQIMKGVRGLYKDENQEAKEVIEEEHMAEAIGYRGLDRNNNDVI